MLALDFIKSNRETVERAIRDKGVGLDLDALLALDYHGRALTVTLKDGTDTASLRTAARNVGLNMDTAEAPRGAEATVPGSRWTVSIAQ